jgi:histidinol dehydrogenase
MRIVEASDRDAIRELLSPQRVRDEETDRRVAEIVADVRANGDAALLRYARTFDRLDGDVEVSRKEMMAAARTVPAAVRTAIRTAAKNIRGVAKRQVPRGWHTRVAPGVTVEQRVVPLDRVGCYVPGGRYPLPSSLLMTVIPAAAAGVGEIVVACPRPDAVVMAAALEAGASRLFRLGGAHAIAALAYGTESIPRVDKIVGPGNRFVASAKAIVAADCGIDARAVLITPNRTLATQVADAVEQQMPADGPAREALARHGAVIVTASAREAMDLANLNAPEHLVVDDEKLAKRVRNAGSVFVGPWSAQVAGDYAIGSNHVLPTAGAARVRGGLSGADFVRQITVQRMTPKGLRRLGPAVVSLARAEGLEGHARSIEIRLAARRAGLNRPGSAKRTRRD